MRSRIIAIPSLLLTFLIAGQLHVAAQTPQVTSANPNAAAQGTINIDIAVGGSGFKQGASSHFVVTGTTDPGGVTVNSTAFVSSNQLTANISVSSTATISSFDILVTNTGGRSGKGTGLLSVISSGNASASSCPVEPLPAGWTAPATLNYVNSSGMPQYVNGLGSATRVKHMTLGGKDVLVAGVGSSASGKLEVFLLDPATGAVLDGTPIGTNIQPQPHITKPITNPGTTNTFGTRALAMGDLNGDGVPDIAIGNKDYGQAFAFLGHVDANGILSYSDQIAFPSTGRSARFGYGLAMGRLNSMLIEDEIAVADPGYGKTQPGGVFIYHFNGSGFDLIRIINQPALTVGIGDVIGDANLDLVAGGIGAAYVFPGPAFSSSFQLSSGGRIAVANVDGGTYADLIDATGSNNSTDVGLYSGPLAAAQLAEFVIGPVAGLDRGWLNDVDAGDINGDGLADVLIGAPNTCLSNVGTAYIYLTNAATPNQAPTRYPLSAPTPGSDFGWSVAAAAGTRLFLVGEMNRTLNGIAAGQVYVYKVN